MCIFYIYYKNNIYNILFQFRIFIRLQLIILLYCHLLIKYLAARTATQTFSAVAAASNSPGLYPHCFSCCLQLAWSPSALLLLLTPTRLIFIRTASLATSNSPGLHPHCFSCCLQLCWSSSALLLLLHPTRLVFTRTASLATSNSPGLHPHCFSCSLQLAWSSSTLQPPTCMVFIRIASLANSSQPRL